MEFDERISRAVDNFMQGYNCAQSVFMAFADLYGLSREQALHVSASFGGTTSDCAMRALSDS